MSTHDSDPDPTGGDLRSDPGDPRTLARAAAQLYCRALGDVPDPEGRLDDLDWGNLVGSVYRGRSGTWRPRPGLLQRIVGWSDCAPVGTRDDWAREGDIVRAIQRQLGPNVRPCFPPVPACLLPVRHEAATGRW